MVEKVRHPALALRAGLPLRPLAGERPAARLAGSAWGAASGPRRPPAWLLAYRLLLALLSVGAVAWSTAAIPSPPAKWLIFLTHWGLLLVTTHALYAALLLFYLRFREQPDHGEGLHWTHQLYWSLYNMAAPIAFLITIFYWSLLYGSDFDSTAGEGQGDIDYGEAANNEAEPEGDPGVSQAVLNVMVHAVNSVVMFLDVMIVALPSRLVHFYQPFLFGMTYLLFNAVYYFTGGTDYAGNHWVYAMIDWSNPGPTIVTVLLTALLLAIAHIFTVLLAVFRDYIVERVHRDPPQNKQLSGLTNPVYKHDV